jgi:hypothetical protein
MIDSEKKEFTDLLKPILKTYRIDPDVDVLFMYWGVLKRYPIEHVRIGFNVFMRNKENKYTVTPAHLVEAIESAIPDGRPGVEEAWATYPHDEESSAVITDEIAEAMRVARPLILDGDRIGARMAFKDAYNRIVARNKAAGVPVRWFPTLGSDAASRDEVIDQAVRIGRISQEHAVALLPAKGSAKSMDEMLLLADQSMNDEQRSRNRARMDQVKEMLKTGVFSK